MGAVIRENIAEHGINAHSPGASFEYNLGDGIELQIWKRRAFPNGLLWKTLETIVVGLWIYMVQGQRCHEAGFRYLANQHGFEVGYGVIQQSNALSTTFNRRDALLPSKYMKPPSSVISEFRNSSLNSISLNASTSNAIDLSNVPWRFRVPSSDITLSILARSHSIDPLILSGLLIAAEDQVLGQIAARGVNTSIGAISFRYRDSISGIVIEVIDSRYQTEKITWGQVRTVLVGLSWFVVHNDFFRTCYFTVFIGEEEKEIGFGSIAWKLVRPGLESRTRI